MASRAPLLVAAALFFVGAAGLLATVPGREVGGTFVPLVRGHANPTPVVVPAFEPTIPSLTFIVPSTAVENTSAVEAATAVITPAPPTPTPTPAMHSAVVAAIANDDSPTPSAPRPVMISSDGEDDTPVASLTPGATTTPEATPTPAASGTPSPEPTDTATP